MGLLPLVGIGNMEDKVPPELWIDWWRIGAICGCRFFAYNYAIVFVLCDKDM
jgi:hypothetical protein